MSSDGRRPARLRDPDSDNDEDTNDNHDDHDDHDRQANEDGFEEAARSPPGQWRLLVAALPCWAITAWAITVPGAGGVLASCAGALGIGLLGWRLALQLTRSRRVSGGAHDARSPYEAPAVQAGRAEAASAAAVSLLVLPLAALMLVGTQTSSVERARADPWLHQAATTGVTVSFEARLAGFPETRTTEFGQRAWVRANAQSPSGAVPMLFWLDGSGHISAHWAPGTHIEVRARLQPQAPGDAVAYTASVTEVTELSGPSLAAELGAVAARLRNGLHDQASRVPGAQLVPGLAVGDTSLVSESLEQAMLESSLSHVTAVSGSNTGLAIAAALWCASRLGAGRRLRIVVAAAALLGFVGIVGPDASVQRAAVMATVLLVGRFGGRPAAALPALGLAVLVLLALDPWQALQPGFALSVAATGGILLAAAPLSRWLHRRTRAPQWLALPFAVAIAAQLTCGPLLLLLQAGIPAVGVTANVAAAPAVPLGTGLGLLAALIEPLSPAFAEAFVRLAALPAGWIAAVAQVCSALPGGRWNWPQGWVGALLLTVCECLLLIAWGLHRSVLALPRFLGGSLPRRAPWQDSPPAPTALRTVAALLVAASLGTITAFTISVPVATFANTPRTWAVVACDIGQGDALLLRDPADPLTVMLVDTGDDPRKLEDCLARFGVGRIALLVLSHDDRDHVGALPAVIDRVETALIAPPAMSESNDARQVISQLEQASVPYRIGAAGDASADFPGLRWRVLAPGNERRPVDSNAASLVMLVDAGPVRVLLLGDTGYEEQASLLRAFPAESALHAQVLKVAHHGSPDQDARLPVAVSAQWALVSVGADNNYGHPSAETLAELARAGTRVLRTDRFGAVALIPHADGSLSAWAERVDE